MRSSLYALPLPTLRKQVADTVVQETMAADFYSLKELYRDFSLEAMSVAYLEARFDSVSVHYAKDLPVDRRWIVEWFSESSGKLDTSYGATRLEAVLRGVVISTNSP